MGVVCVLGIILTGIVFIINNGQKKEEVSAHPTNEIILDEDGTNEFTLPVDATRLTEERLTNDNNFNNYLQNDGFLLSPTRVNVKGFSTVQPSQTILASETTDRNRVLLVGRVGTWNTGVSYNFATTFLFLLDDDNELLDSRQLDGQSINQTEGGYGTEITSIKRLDNGSFNMLTGTRIFNVRLNAAETSIDTVTPTNMTFENNSAPMEMNYNSVEMGLDDRIYYSGHWYQRNESEVFLNNGRMIAILNEAGIEERRVRLRYTPCSDIFLGNALYMSINQLSGVDEGPNGESIIGIVNYVNSNFEINSRIVVWDENGNIAESYISEMDISSIKPLNKISSIEERYFFLKSNLSSKIIRYEATTGNFTDVVDFPGNTDIDMIELADNTYNAIGYVSTITGVFEPFNTSMNPNSAFTAHFSSDFEINSVVTIETGLERDLSINTASFLGGNRYFFGATFSESDVTSIPNTDFLDGIEETLGSNNFWTEKSPNANRFDQNIFGILELQNDHTPAIQAPNSITYNIEDEELNEISGVNEEYNWSVRDNWLITGTKEGSINDESSINVYDVYDTELSLSPRPNTWHYGRLNRNPRSINQRIDWETLGLDETKYGPQLLTYFVTDSQNQVSVNSRWINKTTYQTITDEDKNYAFNAGNFHIPIEDLAISILTANDFKELAKTMAWSLINKDPNTGDYGNGLDEDGEDRRFSDNKVEVNETQLAALQSATVARPYPVDVTYRPETGVEITNRVWVFVTTTNTVADTDTGVVYYADDYSIPYRLRRDHDLDNILTNGNVRAYNYYAKDTTAELATLPNETDGQSNWMIHNQNVILDPLQSGVGNLPMRVRPELSYIWRAVSDHYHEQNEETRGSLQVTLTGNVLLHVRQVILDENEELVFPTEGYLQLKTLRFNHETNSFDEDSSQLVNVSISSQKNNETPRFETFGFDSEQMLIEDHLKLSLTLPEFYEYVGNFVTPRHVDDPNDPMGADHQDKTVTDLSVVEVEFPKMWLDMDGEYFVTLYIRPTTARQSPQPYSWDYKHNDLGEIKTE